MRIILQIMVKPNGASAVHSWNSCAMLPGPLSYNFHAPIGQHEPQHKSVGLSTVVQPNVDDSCQDFLAPNPKASISLRPAISACAHSPFPHPNIDSESRCLQHGYLSATGNNATMGPRTVTRPNGMLPATTAEIATSLASGTAEPALALGLTTTRNRAMAPEMSRRVNSEQTNPSKYQARGSNITQSYVSLALQST